eukprot:2910477-Karenia_brevis.AAC.1
MDKAVEAVAIVRDTGAGPHSAIRLWVRGSARKDLVRTLVQPTKPEPMPPQGCLPAAAHEGWDDLLAGDSPE